MAEQVVVALSAIPNTGKTTLFNRLTGGHQSVGNWPGVSVEKKVGRFSLGEYQVELVDLPGAYSLYPTTQEERVVQAFFLHTPPDVVLNIIDARNLYRGLGLTLQMAMSGLPMVVAVNMMDEARRAGLELDLDVLAEHLGAPVVPISAKSGEGIPALLEALYEVIRHPERSRRPHISCPTPIEEAVKDLARRIERECPQEKLDTTFVAARLLEGGSASGESGMESPCPESVVKSAARWRRRIAQVDDTPLPIACARCRFDAARGLAMEAAHQRPPLPDALSERLDRLLLHPWLGLPLFFLAMLLLFQAIYALGGPLQDLLSGLFDQAGHWLAARPALHSWPGWLRSLLVEGLWQGLAVVTSFFPVIVLFFVAMSIVEDSGYMARAAFLMDRLMHALGLDGKAFIDILLGYGCNVPAVMGTRILSGRYNRLVTMLLIPFSLCSARLQVFVFLAAILFPPHIAPWVIFALYLGSFAAILLIGLLLRHLGIGGRPEPFILEMPPYRFPTASGIALRAWQELKDFLHRAATLIVLGVLLVWFLTHMPPGAEPGGAETLAGRIGETLAPVFRPLGIGWQETVALIFGFIAKEIVIGSLSVIYAGGDLTAQLRAHISPLQGISFMVFTLLYTPCVATLAAIQAESRSWRITLFSVLLGLSSAWLAAFLVYQGGRWLGFS